jgi:hypothetical protein
MPSCSFTRSDGQQAIARFWQELSGCRLSLLDQLIRQQARLHRQCVSARRIIFRGSGAALLDELPNLRPHRLFIFR